MLSSEDLENVVKHTPLVSIDLLVHDYENNFLLGYRTNSPAKGYYFVPGGRILKDESLSSAFSRITKYELGIEIKIENSKFKGVYEHRYGDNFLNSDFSTHYIVLAYILNLEISNLKLPMDQHSDYVWLRKEQIMNNRKIHEYTINYFV